MKFKLAHVSDIHFFQPCKSPMQFFNREFLANFNYIFTRRNYFDSNKIYSLARKLKEEGITSLLISGDLTSMSSEKEFAKATALFKHLIKEGFTVYTFPGNHDVYTRKARDEKTFYKTFRELVDFAGDYSLNLEEHKVCAYKLPHNVHLLLIDATKFNTGTHANGHFTPEIEKNFKSLLKEIPANGSIIVSAHFPYDKLGKAKHRMIEGLRLEALIKNDPRIKIYLHGHRHIPLLKNNETHLVVDSGSISEINYASYSQTECCPDQLITTLYTKESENYVQNQETITR